MSPGFGKAPQESEIKSLLLELRNSTTIPQREQITDRLAQMAKMGNNDVIPALRTVLWSKYKIHSIVDPEVHLAGYSCVALEKIGSKEAMDVLTNCALSSQVQGYPQRLMAIRTLEEIALKMDPREIAFKTKSDKIIGVLLNIVDLHNNCPWEVRGAAAHALGAIAERDNSTLTKQQCETLIGIVGKLIERIEDAKKYDKNTIGEGDLEDAKRSLEAALKMRK